LFAARPIAAGEAVADYAGERILKAESIRRREACRNPYIFEWDSTHDLDGDVPDNPARWANHGCAPNCEAVLEQNHLRLRALRAIAAGEELTFDYGYRLADGPGQPCRCGAPSCVGFIVAQAERWRLRRLLNPRGRSLLKSNHAPAWEVCA